MYYKSELYERIIRESQTIEAKKHTSISAEIQNHVELVFDAGQAIAKTIYKKRLNSISNESNLVGRITTEELQSSLINFSKDVVTVKRRSVIIRDTVGNWLFIHKSFQEFFIGYAAFQDEEFDCIFEYPQNFRLNRKDNQFSATFFYTEMMLHRIRRQIKQLNTFVINQENSRKRSKSFQYITHNDIIETNLLYTHDHQYETFQRESVALVTFIRCFKNLKKQVDLSLANIDTSLSILGNMPYLEVIILIDSLRTISFKEFSRFLLLQKIEIRNSSIADISSLSRLANLSTLNLYSCNIIDKNFTLQSESVKELFLFSPINSLEFLKNCLNITNLAFNQYLGENLSPLLYLKNLKSLSITIHATTQVV